MDTENQNKAGMDSANVEGALPRPRVLPPDILYDIISIRLQEDLDSSYKSYYSTVRNLNQVCKLIQYCLYQCVKHQHKLEIRKARKALQKPAKCTGCSARGSVLPHIPCLICIGLESQVHGELHATELAMKSLAGPYCPIVEESKDLRLRRKRLWMPETQTL